MIAYNRKSGNPPQSERISDEIDDLNQKNRINLEKFERNRFKSTKKSFPRQHASAVHSNTVQC